MFNDFIKVNVKNISYKLGSVDIKEIIENIKNNNDASIILFNELTLTSCSLHELANHLDYIEYANKYLDEVLLASKNSDSVIVLGLPLAFLNNIYNAMIVIYHGEVLGGRTKEDVTFNYEFNNKKVAINSENLYACDKYSFELIFREDLYQNYLYKDSNIVLVVDDQPTLLDDSIIELIRASAIRTHKCFVYCGASDTESSADAAFINKQYSCDHNSNQVMSYKDYLDTTINLKSLKFKNEFKGSKFNLITFKQDIKLDKVEVNSCFQDYNPLDVITLQKAGLKKRLNAIHSHDVVLGFSGGLDSTLALIVLKELSKEMELNIHCLILPCFASSNKTMNNALSLCDELDIDYKIIDITRSVESHLYDLGHDLKTYDVTFENAQARERTQVLFDFANSCNGIVIGTGDLSEIALGFATFNGDHISNYNVNGGITKSVIRKVVNAYSKKFKLQSLQEILKTPISPELVPSKDKTIVQETEKIVGPYELIDFIIYYYLVCGNSIHDIYYLCKQEFNEIENLKYYFKNFFIRFFRNQFKRNSYSDGCKIFNFSFNPRGDFKLSSDLEINSYLDFIDRLED